MSSNSCWCCRYHTARIVNTVLNKIDNRPILSEYCGGGSSSYHPLALLKLVVYGYMTNVYSSRKLEEAAQQNVVFMWLCGMNMPDHNTINNFRGKQLQRSLKSIFVETVKLLAAEGLLSIKDIFTDGTKMEAAANRYTLQQKHPFTANAKEDFYMYARWDSKWSIRVHTPNRPLLGSSKQLPNIRQRIVAGAH